MATDMCAVPTISPQKGTHTAVMSLVGLPFIQKQYKLVVPDPPQVVVSGLDKRPISTTQPLRVPLSGIDTVFTYKLAVEGKASAGCKAVDGSLQCAIQELQLKQGTPYALGVERYFDGKKQSVAARKEVTTLTATSIASATVAEGQIVYAKPKSVELVTDKDITDADMQLVRIEGDKKTEMPVRVDYTEKKIVVSWDEDLARQATFELTALGITGADGSGLEGPRTIRFETSGGPKVKHISVGQAKVPQGTTAVITFDQPILGSQNLGAAVQATGGATVTGGDGTKVFVNFAGVPRCGDVRITISDALQSEYGVTGGSAWRYGTRTLCQVQTTIGTSAKGRSITAYGFGGGAEVVVYTGAIHGSEASTRSLMLRWIDELETNPRAIPANKSVIIVPAINPDGIASGSRTNANNVDLNRNFATGDWKSDITTTSNTPFPGGGGKSAMSEPETRAIAGLVSRVRPQLVLSYHSIGGLLAANQAGNSGSRASQYSRLSGYANTTGSSDTFEYGISGTADDYYGQLGVPSVLIELGSHTYHQFERNRDAMWAMLK